MKRRWTFVLILLMVSFVFFLGGTTLTQAEENEYRYRLVDERMNMLTFSGEWRTVENEKYQAGGFYETVDNGATVEYTFEGAYSVSIIGSSAKSNDEITLKITLDGVEYNGVSVDSIANGLIWSKETDNGSHTIKIEVALGVEARFRFDGLFLQMPQIGVIKTEMDDSDSSFSYYNFATLSGFHFTGEQNATITYKFSGINFKNIEIVSEKNIDSATISIEVNGALIEEALDLKVSGNLGKSIIYTINKNQINADPFAENTLVIKVLSASDSERFFVFHGINFNKYLSYAEEFDEKDYVLTSSDIGELLCVEKKYNDNYELNGFAVSEENISSNVVGSELKYSFVGAGVQILADSDMDCGKADVYIDDVYYGLVNFYSKDPGEKVVFSEKGLSENMVHTLKIVVTDKKSYFATDNYIRVGAVNVLKTSEEINEDNCDQFDYTLSDYQLGQDEELISMGLKSVKSGWQSNIAIVDGVNKNVLYSSTKGNVVSFSFRGTGVELLFVTGPDKGKVNVYVDNKLAGLVNTYSQNEAESVVFRVAGLTHTTHSVRIEVSGLAASLATGYETVFSGYNVVNYIDDTGEATVIDQTDADVMTTFSLNNSSSYYNGSVYFSNLSEYFLEYKFRGTAISVYGNLSLDGGVGTVYLDGVYYGVFDSRATEQTSGSRSLLFVSPELSAGENHTIRIVVESKNNPILSLSYVAIDYFTVENYSKYVFPGYPQAPEINYTEPEFELYPSEGNIYVNQNSAGTVKIGVFILAVVAEGFVFAVAIIVIIVLKKKNG